MSSRSSGPAHRPAAIALCLMLVATAMAVVFAASAHAAAYYKMVLCAAGNGSANLSVATNTASPGNPTGIFDLASNCAGPLPDPAGDNGYLRIAEHEPSGSAGYQAYASISWTVPPMVVILAGGGYTREPNSFNDGWRGRFWAEDFGGGTNNILMQGTNAENAGISWWPTSTFASHLWPFGGYGWYRRFVFEMTCFRQAGCDRSGYNAVDANTIVLLLADVQPSHVWFTDTGAPLLGGRWVRGGQSLTYAFTEEGSGIRFARVKIDGATRYAIDHQATGECATGWSQQNGEFARDFQPCATAPNPIGRSYSFDTASLSDGAHTVQACTQDYAEYVGLNGTGAENCDTRTIRTDNTPPGAPAGLEVTSANPARYLPVLGAHWQLPPNQGSPIAKVHYDVVDSTGKEVEPEKTASIADPTALKEVQAPAHAGDYRLRVWLEDEVGFAGPPASAPIPRDTTPPAAPQDLRVAGPSTTRWGKALDVKWKDLADAGSPIDAVHYQFADASGKPVADARTVEGEGIEALAGIEAPALRGTYALRLWLSDAEGNVGAAASVAVPIDTTPPAAPQGLTVTPPDVPRGAEGFDVRWHDIADDGAPIVAARYQVLEASGKVAVPTQVVKGNGIEAIEDLEAPSRAGDYTLKLWLEDEEGNAGAPVTAPLAYRCVRSDASGATAITAGLGEGARPEEVVKQGTGSALRGRVSGPGGGIAGAAVCVFARVITDAPREFLGFALSGPDGAYRFAIGAGPSRELEARYRSGQREASARAVLQTVVRPSFEVRSDVVAKKRYARFFGQIPGPDNDGVLVVLQVKQGNGWRVFRRYRTREGGRYRLVYRFGRFTAPATYAMRAQVRSKGGYPYLPGNSKLLRLRVIP